MNISYSFTGGKECPACGQRIYHDKWGVSEKLAEDRWAHQQARARELAEVEDFLTWNLSILFKSYLDKWRNLFTGECNIVNKVLLWTIKKKRLRRKDKRFLK